MASRDTDFTKPFCGLVQTVWYLWATIRRRADELVQAMDAKSIRDGHCVFDLGLLWNLQEIREPLVHLEVPKGCCSKPICFRAERPIVATREGP